jgi:hypothetical protein
MLGPIMLHDIYDHPGKRLIDPLTGQFQTNVYERGDTYLAIDSRYHLDGPKIDWVIVGGESGNCARPMHPDWARAIQRECTAAGTAFLFKQWGEWRPSDLCGLDCAAPETLIFDASKSAWRASVDGGWIGDQAVCRVGKKRAGRLLDGIQHDGVPA